MSEPMQAHDAEISLLGAAMSGAPDLDDLLATVEPSDFYRPFHEQIWSAIGRVHRAGNKPDPVAVRLALAEDEVRHDPMELVNLAAAAPVVAQAPYYATAVVEASGLRALQSAAVAVQQIASTPGNLETKREEARARLDEACRGRNVSKALRIADLMPETLDVAENGQAAVLSTPWPDIDRAIGGIAPGRLIVFGAMPGGGKSISLTNLALHVAAHHGHAAMIASLEMPRLEVMQRLLAAHAGVSLTALANGTTDERDWQRIAAKHDEINRLPLYVDDTAHVTIQGIRRMAREVQRERDDLALIAVDYLQLVAPEERRKSGSRAEDISAIARGLKLLARETGACVVAGAQINREGARSHTGPTMHDIREGGAENDADQVILLHRPDIDIPDVTATVGKNRHGPLATTTLQMQGHYARLASVSWQHKAGLA